MPKHEESAPAARNRRRRREGAVQRRMPPSIYNSLVCLFILQDRERCMHPQRSTRRRIQPHATGPRGPSGCPRVVHSFTHPFVRSFFRGPPCLRRLTKHRPAYHRKRARRTCVKRTCFLPSWHRCEQGIGSYCMNTRKLYETHGNCVCNDTIRYDTIQELSTYSEHNI
jgi:hypothetical protein